MIVILELNKELRISSNPQKMKLHFDFLLLKVGREYKLQKCSKSDRN